MYSGPHIKKEGLVFGFDTGYGVADNDTSTRYFKGKPTTNLVTNAATFNGGWASYSNGNDGTFITEFGTTGYRMINRGSWNGIYQNFNLGSSGTYTFSAWFKYLGGASDNNGATVYVSNYGAGDTATGINKSIVGEWQRISKTISVTSPTNVYFYIISYGGTYGGSNSTWEVTMPQIELSGIRTPFVNGSRSNNLSLLDTSKNYSLSVANMSFNDSTGAPIFDGTNDYFDIPSSSVISGTQDFTIESAYHMTGQGGGVIFGNYGPAYTSNSIWFSGQYGFYLNGGVYKPGYPIAPGKYHMVATRTNGFIRLYFNGVLVNSGTLNASVASNINYRVGIDVNSSGGEPFAGTIYALRVYNRAISETEVLNNYNMYKLRLGLS